jgi:RNA polymerase sigma-70 factor (ECF subfamily)
VQDEGKSARTFLLAGSREEMAQIVADCRRPRVECQHKFRAIRASCYLKRVVPEDVRVLVTRILAGEKTAWDAFAEEYSPLVYRILGKFANLTKDDRHDVHNTVFVILLKRGLQKFRGATVHELRAYLKVITDNVAKDYLNGRDPLAETETEWDEFEHPSPDPAPDLLAGGKEALEQVRLCLLELPVVDQEIFWMAVNGHSYEEISVMLEIPMGTVASKFNRTRAKVKECLTKVRIL